MSLRTKVISGVLLIDLIVFGALAFLIPNDLRRQKERELQARTALFDLFYTLAASISKTTGQGPDLIALLDWPHWDQFADALLMEGKVARTPVLEESVRSQSEAVPIGLFFNPKGKTPRDFQFDRIAKQRIVEALERRQPVETDNAIALPIVRRSGDREEIWGGGYFVLQEPENPILSLRGILLLSGASLLLLALTSYWALSKLVLEPVEALANASRKVAGGDLQVSLQLPHRHDELALLMHSFDEMVFTLRNHQEELKKEVAIATEKAALAQHELFTAQRLAALGTLTAGIAHEINNPLGGMINAIRALDKKDLSPEKRAEYLELARSGLERIRNIVQRVLQATPRNKRRERVALRPAIEKAVEALRFRLEEEKVSIQIEAIPEQSVLNADPSELEQVFLNLFVNSLDAIASRRATEPVFHGRILVRVLESSPRLEVLVEDNGGGMKEEDLARSLDPFFTTKEVGKGSGLGLFLIYGIVQGMGGKLELQNRKGEGLSVKLEFPAMKLS